MTCTWTAGEPNTVIRVLSLTLMNPNSSVKTLARALRSSILGPQKPGLRTRCSYPALWLHCSSPQRPGARARTLVLELESIESRLKSTKPRARPQCLFLGSQRSSLSTPTLMPQSIEAKLGLGTGVLSFTSMGQGANAWDRA